MAPSDKAALEQLEATVTSAQALCQQLATALDDVYKNPSTPASAVDSKIIPLTLARDAATLLLSGPVLGVASAVQACDPALYTAFFRKELAWRSRRILVTLSELLGKIPKDGKILSGAQKTGFAAESRGSLPATGILWSACDEVTALVSKGISGYFAKRVDEWRDTLKDVMEELKEWGDEEPDDDEDDDDDDDTAHDADNDNNETIDSAQDILDDLMGSGQAIPRDDPKGIRPRLESTLRRVRLVVLLYQAISKRRLKKLPALPPPADSSYTNMPQRLDEAARVLEALPDSFGDLASAFYEMEPSVIDQAADDCFFAAFAAGELLSAPWDGGQDEFSEWTEKFKTEIKKS
ncbi:hypothetical protein NLG97_g6712 [Lecanicillium saksenae]|uniref:Uncharacterized protein n=1 Tax=Lecanicillium saksenae TaxID=468837 RepID=A0ACC1QSN6_9HYPO|nr:hypothetical protein NLG97_g6712 [Lecanicillium saksenae]